MQSSITAEYQRVRRRILNYKSAYYEGSSWSVKRVGDSTMVVTASPPTGTAVINSITMVKSMGPRIRMVTDKFCDFSDAIPNTLALDALPNVKVLPRSRRGVKLAKFHVPKSIRHGQMVVASSIFTPVTTGVPAVFRGNWVDTMRFFYQVNTTAPVNSTNFIDADKTTCPENFMLQLDSFPIPPIPVASGSAVSTANSVTLEFFGCNYFVGVGADVAGNM